MVLLNMPARALRDGIRAELEDERIPPDRRIAKYLKVFNGLRGSGLLVTTWGITFFFSWYSVISNPAGVDEMTSSLLFNCVSGTVYAAPLFFFCSGFLQTNAFMQRNQEEDMFTPAKLGPYLALKFFRYVPLNAMALLAVVYIAPFIGSGPIWGHFHKLMEPCHTKWWANLLWISNFYPAAYDDRCLPWTWFVPCYVQLSLLLPFILAIYAKSSNRFLSGIIYLVMFIAALGGTFGLVYAQN